MRPVTSIPGTNGVDSGKAPERSSVSTNPPRVGDVDADLSRSGLGNRPLAHLQVIGRTELIHHYRAHALRAHRLASTVTPCSSNVSFAMRKPLTARGCPA